MKIRELTHPDLYDAENLIKEVFFASGNLGMDHTSAKKYLEKLSIHEDQLICFGAYEKTLEGVIAADPDTFEVKYLYVREDHQKQGIATALLEQMKKTAEAHHIGKLTANVILSAHPFFIHRGFEDTDGVVDSAVSAEYLLQKDKLGTYVHVIIDHPIGTVPVDTPEEYACNCGYADDEYKDAVLQEAYVIGPDQPIESFDGCVVGILYRSDSVHTHWLVCESKIYDRTQVINAIGAQEQYHDTFINWL